MPFSINHELKIRHMELVRDKVGTKTAVAPREALKKVVARWPLALHNSQKREQSCDRVGAIEIFVHALNTFRIFFNRGLLANFVPVLKISCLNVPLLHVKGF